MSGYSVLEKQIAYALDPKAWESYSGQPKYVKQEIEKRRSKTMAKAREIVQDSSVAQFVEELTGGSVYTKVDEAIHRDRNQSKLDLQNKVSDALETARVAVEKRSIWRKNRGHQMDVLGDLGHKLLVAYHARNPNLAKIDELVKKIKSVANSGAYDRFDNK